MPTVPFDPSKGFLIEIELVMTAQWETATQLSRKACARVRRPQNP